MSAAIRQHAVLFDLDGTLIDTAPDIVAAANCMLDELQARPLPFDKIAGFIGNGVPTLVQRILDASALEPELHTVALASFNRHYAETNGRFGRLFPGVQACLAGLRAANYRLACVTNKPLAFALPLLQMHHIDIHFGIIVGGDSLASMKPAPEPLWHACHVLDVAPRHACMVGDSGVDVAAAQAAEVPVLIVRHGAPEPVAAWGPAVKTFTHFDQLAGLLAAIPVYPERELQS
ncbi:MAG: phosphoglycolate phosphatase [Pseudomonadota bacterium]